MKVIIIEGNKVTETQNSQWYESKAWPTVLSTNDYYPFGLQMASRKMDNAEYRYGFNGKEIDNWNAKGEAPPSGGGPPGPPPAPNEPVEDPNSGIVYDYGFRIYNPTIAKFLSVDPLTASFAWNSPYSYAENDVIRSIDLDGLEKVYYTANYSKYQMAIRMVIMRDTELMSIWSEARKPSRASQFDVYFGTHSSKTNEASGFQADLGSRAKLMTQFENFSYNDKQRLGNKYNEVLDAYNKSKALFADMGINREDVMKSINNGKTVLAISLNREHLNLIYSGEGSINYEALSEGTFAFMHEIDLHLKNELNGISKDGVEEHKQWYNILESSEFYKKYKAYIEAGRSPRKDQVNKDSRAAEVYEKVENATKIMQSKYE